MAEVALNLRYALRAVQRDFHEEPPGGGANQIRLTSCGEAVPNKASRKRAFSTSVLSRGLGVSFTWNRDSLVKRHFQNCHHFRTPP